MVRPGQGPQSQQSQQSQPSPSEVPIDVLDRVHEVHHAAEQAADLTQRRHVVRVPGRAECPLWIG